MGHKSQTEMDGELPIEVLLKKVPEVPWNVLLGSGVRVPDKAEKRLQKAWDAHVRAQTPSQTNPDWTWDEEILAFDIYLRFGAVGKGHKEVAGLSKMLRSLTIHPLEVRSPTFRNSNGVARKLGDIQSHRPGHTGMPTAGSKLDSEIWKAYDADPKRLQELAKLIRSGAEVPNHPEDDEVEIDDVHQEGRLVYRMHRQRERDPKLRKRKIAQVMKINNGKLACEACDSDLESKYGSPGAAIFECHHIEPLHLSGPTRSKIGDVALLCPNCHRVAHRLDPWPTIAELKVHIA
jgi:5-methylcytosine-specific restriction protein A